MNEQAPRIQRVVVKVGSSVLTGEAGHVLPERIEQLADQLAQAAAAHHQLLLVSSGAVACGMARLGLARRPRSLAQLQACAAIGQGELMHLYTRIFSRHGIVTAQVLLTQEDLSDRSRFRNAKQTLLTLLHRRVLPVINENDTVSVEEITFGDNDRLAAVVASTVDAHLLVILSDVDGFLQDGKRLERVDAVSRLHADPGRSGTRETTRGGMRSKLEAARMAGHSGIPMIIANGARPAVLTDLLAGASVGTLFVPPRRRLTARKWWIAYALRQPSGSIAIDEGAATAILERGTSLLASGVLEARGRFEAGAFVTVVDRAGAEVARGVCGFSAAELQRVRGLRSAEVARLVGSKKAREVIHRDHLVLLRDLR